MRKTYITLAGVVFGLAFNLHAQTAIIGGAVGVGTPVSSSSDSVVAVTADAYGLSQVAPTDLPRNGTYWVVVPYGGMVPMPCQPTDLTLPIYAITDSIFLVDSTGGQVSVSPRQTATMGSAQALTTAVNTQGNAIANLIEQVQGAQMMRDMAMMFGMDVPSFGDGGGDGGYYTNSYIGFTIDTNQLWLEITNVSNGISYLNAHHATNQVYAIWTTTDLLQPFTVETELWPTNGDCQPFTLANYDRQFLFVRAMDWTGVTHSGNTTPDWWLWKYFGTTALSDANLDSQGCPLAYDYANNLDPNVIQFTIEAANQYVHSTTASAQLNIAAGSPCYYAVLVNGQTTTNWLPFVTTNVSVYLGATDGVYNVSIGLRGLPANAQQTWDSYTFTLDRVAPKISLTNPAGGTVLKPYLQLQGYADKPLASLSYDISNGNGSATNQDAFVTDQSFDPNKFDFTTNYFQAYDVPLATNANYITLRVTDRAGNTTTTNFNVVLDYSGATNPPTVNVLWPQDGMAIGGAAFTLRGTMSDETGNVTAQIVDEAGNTNTVAGLVERNGMFWVENLPLTTNGDNTITLTATDAAGNVTTTNLTVTASDVVLTINSTPTGDALYQGYGSVSGTISDSSYSVVVNGVTVTNDYWTDGTTWHWEVDNVPIYGQGTATFDAVANPPEQSSFSQARFQAQSSTPSAPPLNLSLTVVKDAQVVITTYHVTKSISSTNSSATNAFSYARVKDYAANYATNSAGQWYLQDYQGTATDNYQSWCGTNWNWTQDWVLWSDLGDETSQTNSNGNSYYYPFITSSWDAYGHFTGLPDEDLWAFGWADVIPPQWIYHYWANNVQQHLVSGSWAADIAVTARTTMQLFTGGKALIQRRNLIQLQCGAEAYGTALPSDQWGPVFAEWAGVPKTPIAAARLRALGQWVGADGNLWLALPDNEALTLNLAAPAQHYNAWATPTKCKLNIVANGNPLAADHVRTGAYFCVGQKVNFQAIFSPDISGSLNNSSPIWIYTADYINNHWIDINGCEEYNIAPIPAMSNPTTAWFYNQQTQDATANLGMYCHFNNGQSVYLVQQGKFNVFTPTVSVSDIRTRYFRLSIADFLLGLGDTDNTGAMVYQVNYNSKDSFSGTGRITQLCQLNYSGIHYPSCSFSDYRRDGSEAYEENNIVPGTAHVSLTLQDGPLNVDTFPNRLQGAFKDYIRFRPDAGNAADNIFVTLGIVSWNMLATATSSGIDSAQSPDPTGPSNSNDFPIWTNTR